MNIFESLIDSLSSTLSDMWERIKAVAKWIKVHLIRFKENIVNFFRRTVYKYDRNTVKALAIKANELLKDEKNYNIYNIGLMTAYYDTVTSSIIEDDIEIIAGDKVDQEIENSFGDKQIIVLQ